LLTPEIHELTSDIKDRREIETGEDVNFYGLICLPQPCPYFHEKNIGKGEGHDTPYVEGVKDWRDCLLCLLSEILNELEWLRETLSEGEQK